MTLQTRSSAKASPGRLTRNSIFGRPPPSPLKPQNVSTVRAREAETAGKPSLGNMKGSPWLACRDAHGVMTTVAVSETGEGIHVRWHYSDECEIDQDEEEDVEMIVDDERGVTPPTTGPPSNAARRPFPQTPMVLDPYDAGSVIRTPVKKGRPLQRSPPRIGDRGIRCLYEKSGVLRELNGGARVVLRHPVGSTANLSREQVERLETEREDKIIQVQMEKLLAQKQRMEEEEKYVSDSGYEDETETEISSFSRGLRREGTDETILVSHSELSDIAPPVSPKEIESAPNFFRGPNGELFDQHGRQMLGREGTILVDSTHEFPRRVMREEAFLESMEIVDHSSFDHCDFGETNGLRRTRFGPEGTELID